MKNLNGFFRVELVRWCLLGLVQASLSLAAMEAGESATSAVSVTVTETNYHGWSPAWRLSNGQVEAIVVPAVGRVMQFRFIGAPGVFWENPARFGQLPDPDARDWGNFGGDKTWPAPQADWPAITGRAWPPPRAFDAMPLTAQVEGTTIILTSPVDRHYGLRTRRHVHLDPEEPVLRISTFYEQVESKTNRVGIWIITQLGHPEQLEIPLPNPSIFANGFNLQSGTAPPSLKVQDGLLSMSRDPKQSFKIGTDASALIWMDASFTLRIEAPRRPGKPYPDHGSSAEIYTNPDPLKYVELEMLGPLVNLQPGESTEFTTVYRLSRR